MAEHVNKIMTTIKPITTKKERIENILETRKFLRNLLFRMSDKKRTRYEEEDSGTSTGQVVIGYKGGLWNDFMWKVCIQTAWEYLSGTSNSPLHASMIECDDPVCGSIDGSLEEFAVTSYTITFDNVPVDKLDQIGMVCTNGLSLLNVKFQEFQFTCHHSNLVYYNATLMNR